ncbi:unnamed protein product [Paramecium sonneborni]|uniref:Uncharacterized protein n=1 Tax=Paramecium sonneborni TaxID=65129 RepID=A0A8S1R5J1_9CILI|nr:unnamed protein product [Paramecium sonneborni]
MIQLKLSQFQQNQQNTGCREHFNLQGFQLIILFKSQLNRSRFKKYNSFLKNNIKMISKQTGIFSSYQTFQKQSIQRKNPEQSSLNQMKMKFQKNVVKEHLIKLSFAKYHIYILINLLLTNLFYNKSYQKQNKPKLSLNHQLEI